MKLIYTVIDGMGDLPTKKFGNETPLGAATTPNMDRLARNGKTGLMYPVAKGVAPESDVAVISILGYDPFKYATGRGVLEAVGAGMNMQDGDLAVRCNFATLRNGRLADRRAGRNLNAEEALELSKTINEKVKLTSHPARFEFKSTIAHRAVLIIKTRDKQLSSKITNTDPAYAKVEGLGVAEKTFEMTPKKCEPLDHSEAARTSATLVNEFVRKSHDVLERHEINKNRTNQGKLKANFVLTRDAGNMLPKFFNISQKYDAHFACLADMPVEKGIANLAGMSMVELPYPSDNIKHDLSLRVEKLFEALPHFDCFYIHVKGPDVPGHDGDFQLKKKLISLIDEHFFGPLLKRIDLAQHLVCITADHSTPCALKAHSDDPVPVLISGNRIKGENVGKFSEKECLRGSLGLLEKGTRLMPLLMNLLKKGN